MKTLLTVTPELLQEAQRLSRLPTKSATVEMALQQYVRQALRKRLIGRFGKGFGLTATQLHRQRADRCRKS